MGLVMSISLLATVCISDCACRRVSVLHLLLVGRRVRGWWGVMVVWPCGCVVRDPGC